MPKNKLILDKILEQNRNNNDGDDRPLDDQYESDSDAELAQEFAEGKLKPGLYGLVPFKRTIEQINDKEGLTRKLNEFKIFQDNWLERLDLVSEPAKITSELLHQYGDLNLKVNRKGEISIEEFDNSDQVQNDFKRELLFYRQAQTTVIESIKRFHNQYGIKETRRPDDFFAEMLKSDEHMKKVHEKLQAKQTSMEASEKAKRQRELKKYGKKVQQEIQLKRQQEKKELLEKIQRYKKGKVDSLDFLNNDNQESSLNNKKQKSKSFKTKVTKKQRYKEAKYGYGGRKKRSKYNSAESAADFSGFSAHKHGIKSTKRSRPGKSRRQKLKNKSK